MKGFLIFLILGSGILIFGTIYYFVIDNRYIELNNAYEAQVSEDQVVYDEVWKVIQQQAGVTENYSESFRKNYKAIMEERYNTGGALMKWVQEANPNFSTAMYEKLMNSIEDQRAKFTQVQKKLISKHNELKNLLTLQPSKFFLVTIGGHTLPDLEIVTSTRTGKAFETGKDDDIELFKKDTTN